MEKDIRNVRSDIEDVAFTGCSLRVTPGDVPYCRRGCIERNFVDGSVIRTSTGTEAGMIEMRS